MLGFSWRSNGNEVKTAGHQAARGLKRVSRQFPITSLKRPHSEISRVPLDKSARQAMHTIPCDNLRGVYQSLSFSTDIRMPGRPRYGEWRSTR